MPETLRGSLAPPAAHRVLVLLLALWPLLAPAQPQYVFFEKTPGSFPLVAGGRAATFYASETDYPGVLRTVRDVQADVQRVTGHEATFLTDAPPRGKAPLVLVGTLGHSPLLDGLVQSGKLDVSNLAGRWETFVVQAIGQPLPGVEQALVVAGSDQRGTIFGLYDLSRQLGVSPWHWWANAPVIPHRNIFVAPGRHTLGEPVVKYRALPDTDLDTESQPYERRVELLLRLRGNCFWPAAPGRRSAAAQARATLATSYGLLPRPPAPSLTIALGSRDNEPNPLPRLRAALRQAAARPGQLWLLQAQDLRPLTYPVSVFFDYAWQPAGGQ